MLHSHIFIRLRSLWVTNKPSVNIRFSKAVLKDMDALIESGEYASRSDFINRAVMDALAGEGLRPIIRDEIKKILQEERG